MDIQLGMDDVLDAAPPVLTRSAWKPLQAPTQTPLASTLHQLNDDQLFVSMNDQSLANTLSSFRTKLTTVVSTMLEVSKQERQEERKEYADSRRIENEQQEAVKKKREEQRKDQEIKRKAERRDDIQQMEKLEKRKEEQRVEEQGRREEQRISDQRAHDLLLLNMMKNMLQGASVQPQSTTTGVPTQASTSTSQNEQELVILMEQANLTQTNVELTK